MFMTAKITIVPLLPAVASVISCGYCRRISQKNEGHAKPLVHQCLGWLLGVISGTNRILFCDTLRFLSPDIAIFENIFIIFALEKCTKNILIIYAPRRVLERSEELFCEIYNSYNGT